MFILSSPCSCCGVSGGCLHVFKHFQSTFVGQLLNPCMDISPKSRNDFNCDSFDTCNYSGCQC